ncbi:YqgQ family protein [Virgibacillus ainsalahensis]
MKNGDDMETIYDIQQMLRRYGTFIYTGNRFGDLELMEMEINEMYQFQFISKTDYMQARLLLRKEITRLREQRKRCVSDE